MSEYVICMRAADKRHALLQTLSIKEFAKKHGKRMSENLEKPKEVYESEANTHTLAFNGSGYDDIGFQIARGIGKNRCDAFLDIREDRL